MNSKQRQKLTRVFSRLYKFARFTYGRKFIEGHHLKRICRKLELVAKGDINRLIINTPPRYSKTTIVSVDYSVWRIFKNPNLNILIITYGDELSEEIGLKIRILIKKYGHLFNVYLSPHTASKTKLKFVDRDGKDYKGRIQAVGYRGAITGKDADEIIIDDLIKYSEEALSPAYNKKIVDIYKTAIYTRLWEHSNVIIDSTRWAKDDLVGWLLENSAEHWETLIIPAVDDEGNSTWPERFSNKKMATTQEEEGPFWWAALYMQDPEELKGDVFEGEFITIPESEVDPNEFDKLVLYVDRAGTKKADTNDPDYTAMLLMARLKDDSYLVLFTKRFQESPAGNKKRIKKTADTLRKKYGNIFTIWIELEPGSMAKDSFDIYKNEVLLGYSVRENRPTGSKEIRAIDVASDVEVGKVKFINAAWNGPLFLEMRAFPYGNHDDQVDTLSGSYNKLKKKTVLRARKRSNRR